MCSPERILFFTCTKDRNERYVLNYLHKTLKDVSLNIYMCALYEIFLQKLESAINTFAYIIQSVYNSKLYGDMMVPSKLFYNHFENTPY